MLFEREVPYTPVILSDPERRRGGVEEPAPSEAEGTPTAEIPQGLGCVDSRGRNEFAPAQRDRAMNTPTLKLLWLGEAGIPMVPYGQMSCPLPLTCGVVGPNCDSGTRGSVGAVAPIAYVPVAAFRHDAAPCWFTLTGGEATLMTQGGFPAHHNTGCGDTLLPSV